MPLEFLIPIAIFVALAALIVIVLRRFGAVIAESRDIATFRRSVEDLAKRIDDTLAVIIADVDGLRRQQIDADEIVEPLDRALEALLGYSEEARALGGLPIVAGPKAAFVDEIDRADRALQMVEHGCGILGAMGGVQRFGEAQTAIKRGYLNVLHAREAIARHAKEIAEARGPEETRWLNWRRSRGG